MHLRIWLTVILSLVPACIAISVPRVLAQETDVCDGKWGDAIGVTRPLKAKTIAEGLWGGGIGLLVLLAFSLALAKSAEVHPLDLIITSDDNRFSLSRLQFWIWFAASTGSVALLRQKADAGQKQTIDKLLTGLRYASWDDVVNGKPTPPARSRWTNS